MDSPKTNGTTTVHLPSSNQAPSLVSEKFPSSYSLEKSETSEQKSNHSSVKQCLGENLLTLATLLGVVLGIALGIGLRSTKTWTKREIMYVNFPGELFLNMLKCLILPLIMSSLVAAIGSLDTKLTGKIGYRAVGYYIATTILAIILGIIMVITIKPGVGKTSTIGDAPTPSPSLPEDSLMDLVRNMFPPNIIEASMKQTTTVLTKPPENDTKNDLESSMENFPLNSTSNINPDKAPEINSSENVSESSTENRTVTNITDLHLWTRESKKVDQMNILGIVVFSVVLGLTLARMKKKGKPLLDVFVSLSDAMMIITKLVIWFSPLGVMFLIASKVMEMEDLTQVIGQIGLYSITVLGGVLIHGFIVLPLIYFLFTRKNPYSFIAKMGQALATAFGTASSSATLPVTIASLEEKLGIDPRVARFCLPIGATINMDGTALYEAVAAIFIAQVRKVPLSFGSIIAISITSTAASIGAAGIPQAGIVTMVMVLNVVGLPPEDITLILVVDWILDRFRTLVNVLGDAFGAAIVGHHSIKDLAELEDENINTEMTAL